MILYTQPECMYCDMLKEKLVDYKFEFDIVNIKENETALFFIKSEGHKTVPQLYHDGVHLNTIPTGMITKEFLLEQITETYPEREESSFS
jgi:glutaredoxin